MSASLHSSGSAALRASLTGKEGEETLRTRVDHVDLVQRDGVDHLFPHLQLSLGALNKLGLREREVQPG